METTTITWKSSIKGWLILPALSFLITPLRFIFILFMALSHPESFRIGLNIAILSGDIVLLLLLYYLAYFFFRCYRYTPILYILYRMVYLLFITAIYLSSTHYMLTSASNMELCLEFFGGIIGSLLFIPYFIYSKKAKEIFVTEGDPGKAADRFIKPCEPFLQKFMDFLTRAGKLLIPMVIGFIVVQFIIILIIIALV
jgi:hypothetical protein